MEKPQNCDGRTSSVKERTSKNARSESASVEGPSFPRLRIWGKARLVREYLESLDTRLAEGGRATDE
jgi:hypothetical protein